MKITTIQTVFYKSDVMLIDKRHDWDSLRLNDFPQQALLSEKSIFADIVND